MISPNRPGDAVPGGFGEDQLVPLTEGPSSSKAVLEVYKPHGRQIGGNPARNALLRVSHYALDSLAPNLGHVLVATLTHHASCAIFGEDLC